MDDLDLTARRVVMASMLYYGLDSPSMMTDGEFDKACVRLAEEWDRLEPVRKWQLHSPEAIHTTGNHVKVTAQAASAAVHWLRTNTHETRRVYHTRPARNPRSRKRGECPYWLPGEFAF
jgi:hypothetical protein